MNACCEKKKNTTLNLDLKKYIFFFYKNKLFENIKSIMDQSAKSVLSIFKALEVFCFLLSKVL